MSGRLGRYEILKTIASGGMATVVLGRVVGAGGFERLVAIKSMHPHIAAEPDFVAMFLDEARLAARVRHPNVVPTIDVQEDPLFLVMEFVEGPSLHQILRGMKKAEKRVPLPILLRVFLDVLAGLHAAHELTDVDGTALQLVHRDVSPQNMLVGVDGISRITDFGVARAESRLSSTRGGQVKGKIGYMAPEQVRSGPIDRRCDVYAAAVVLWELLTNRPLFRADNEGALVAQVAMGATTSPREVEPSVPPSIDAVCMHALRAAPEERFPTAGDFADAIEAAAAEANVAIATPRAVAAFVKELAAHNSPQSMAPPPAVLASGDVAVPASRASASGAAILSGPIPDAGGAPTARWKVPALAVGAGVAVAVALFVAFGRSGPSPASSASSVAAVTAAPPTASLGDPPPVASPRSSASAPTPPTSASGAAPSASGAPAPSWGPGPRVPPGRPPPGQPTSFRPSGL